MAFLCQLMFRVHLMYPKSTVMISSILCPFFMTSSYKTFVITRFNRIRTHTHLCQQAIPVRSTFPHVDSADFPHCVFCMASGSALHPGLVRNRLPGQLSCFVRSLGQSLEHVCEQRHEDSTLYKKQVYVDRIPLPTSSK